MGSVEYFEASDFSLDVVRSLKGDKRIVAVFSTFGEREAELIHEKISLLRSELGDLVDRIYLSHRRAGEGRERTEEMALKADPEASVLLCNTYQVPDMGAEKGKGADMRRVLHFINREFPDANERSKTVVVFLDADVVPEHFGSHFVTGLAGAVLKGQDFAKAGFWRAMGRVKKFVAQPLFSAVDHPRLRELTRLSYPLSGEVAGSLEFFNGVHFWQIYGVETGINIDSCLGDYRIADVNLGLYDHEHHGDPGIQKMAFGIIRTYLKQLMDYGILELKDGAKLSDHFLATYIDENSERQPLEFDLTEIKYEPLERVLK